MSDLIITIGRENGSGGREVGRIVADMLGVKCYDREIVEATARNAGVSVEEVERSEESRRRSPLYFGGIPSSNPMFEEQSETIRLLASNGPCVFVGRCADYVLRDKNDVINVFVTAPMPDRIRRSASRNGISEADAEERVRKKDTERAEYYRRYTGRIWGPYRTTTSPSTQAGSAPRTARGSSSSTSTCAEWTEVHQTTALGTYACRGPHHSFPRPRNGRDTFSFTPLIDAVTSPCPHDRGKP